MMDQVANLPPKQRQEVFAETAARKGLTPAMAEKDFWVCWTLGRLFAQQALAQVLVFKGGTSLSKVFNLINRFSEDIDLILDWALVADERDPLAERSAAQQDEVNKALNQRTQAYIAHTLLPQVSDVLAPLCTCAVNAEDPHVIDVTYPAAFAHDYLRPEVRLEIGPLAVLRPASDHVIRPYAAQEFPSLFGEEGCTVRALAAERTFWEKATILHQEAHRPADKPQPSRYSRHYYDLAMMSQTQVKPNALADFDLLADVVAFKKRFYPRAWARYDLAKPGSLKLTPPVGVLIALRRDYAAMRNMIFGEYPEFDDLLASLKSLEDEINSPP